MSKILSYNNKTTKTSSEDWIAVEPYSDDDIRQIKDPNGGLSRNPRTAIPSPFAQLDLVKNAFEHLQPTPQGMVGIASEQIMVSNALDVAQLFFEYENHRDQLHIVRWNKTAELERLKASPEHRLYGETLELFLQCKKIPLVITAFLISLHETLCHRQNLHGFLPTETMHVLPQI